MTRFEPTPKQLEFTTSDSLVTVWRPRGWATGGTTALVSAALRTAAKVPGSVGLFIGDGYRHNHVRVRPTLDSAADALGVGPVNWNGELQVFGLSNGSHVYLRAPGACVDRLRGYTVGALYVNKRAVTGDRAYWWATVMSTLRHPLGPRQVWAVVDRTDPETLMRLRSMEAFGVTEIAAHTDDNPHAPAGVAEVPNHCSPTTS